MHTKHTLAKEILPRYLKASKEEKTKILDEFCAITHYDRTYAISKLKTIQCTRASDERPPGTHTRRKERIYDAYVSAVVEQLYEVVGGIGVRRMHPILGTLLEKGIAFGHMSVDPFTEAKIRKISKSTLGRMIKTIREKHSVKGISTTRPGTLLKSEIPLRVGVWEETVPGFSEIDLVAHCGDNASGHFISTLDTTDIATGWFEAEPIMGKAQERVVAALTEIENRMPYRLSGIDSDNGSEFINRMLFTYCVTRTIIFTRSRPYKKNDNAHIEQKNYTTVRQVVGYQRFDTEEVLALMYELYRGPLRLYINFFQPSEKCVQKTRVGSRIVKIYDTAQTPYQRLIAHPQTSASTKETVNQLFETLDPFMLRKDIDRLVREIQKRGRWHM